MVESSAGIPEPARVESSRVQDTQKSTKERARETAQEATSTGAKINVVGPPAVVRVSEAAKNKQVPEKPDDRSGIEQQRAVSVDRGQSQNAERSRARDGAAQNEQAAAQSRANTKQQEAKTSEEVSESANQERSQSVKQATSPEAGLRAKERKEPAQASGTDAGEAEVPDIPQAPTRALVAPDTPKNAPKAEGAPGQTRSVDAGPPKDVAVAKEQIRKAQVERFTSEPAQAYKGASTLDPRSVSAGRSHQVSAHA